MNTQYVITQEIINKMNHFSQTRRRNEEFKYERTVHNQEIQAVIAELSIGIGE